MKKRMGVAKSALHLNERLVMEYIIDQEESGWQIMITTRHPPTQVVYGACLIRSWREEVEVYGQNILCVDREHMVIARSALHFEEQSILAYITNQRTIDEELLY